ncbi:MAG: O-antigen ligase family protein [Bacteroidia bacterium]
MSISKVGLSVGSIIILLAGLWQWRNDGFKINVADHKMPIVISSLFLLSLIGFFFTENTQGWLDDLRIKLPIALLPLAISICAPFSKRKVNMVFALYMLGIIVVAALSIFSAYADYEHLSKRVSQNSSVQVITSINHIYFGPMLGLAGLLGINWGLRQDIKATRIGFIVGGLLAVMLLHLFTSRTGFLAFYAGVGGWILWLMVRKKAWLWGLGSVALICLLPVIAFYTVPTFKTRVEVTRWDFQQYVAMEKAQEGGDFSDLTVGLRFVAWKASYNIWKEQPVMGTGLGDMDQALLDEYARSGVIAKESQLLTSSHNEYMEYLGGTGVVGLLWLLLVLAWPISDKSVNSESLLWIHTAMVAAACLSESFLERQHGVAFYILFGVFFATLSKK